MNLLSKPKIVLLGLMSHYPVAGVVWQTLHYLVGFQRLGYEVFYVEAHGRSPSMLTRVPSDDGPVLAAKFIAEVMNRFGLAGQWAYYSDHPHPRHFGLSELQLQELYGNAALIINLHGSHIPIPELTATNRLVYLETDPVEVEIEIHNKNQECIDYLAPHCAFFTYGENFGNADCLVPVPEPFKFLPTRQPVIMDFWEDYGRGDATTFTTIGNWRQPSRDITFKNEIYRWSKDLEFHKFIDLPARTAPQPFELALSTFNETDQQMLEGKGWRVRRALDFSTDLDAYRQYIAGSRGEFTVAKDQNVRLRSGWFSDRAITYLAAGRPVITQETGFSNTYPTGEGLFAFSTMEEILAAIEDINSDYERHRRAALTIARECFSYDVVLTRMLSDLGISRGPRASRTPCSASSPNAPVALSHSSHPMGGEGRGEVGSGTQKQESPARTPMTAAGTAALPETERGARASRTPCSAPSPNTSFPLSDHPMGGEGRGEVGSGTQKQESPARTPMTAAGTAALPETERGARASRTQCSASSPNTSSSLSALPMGGKGGAETRKPEPSAGAPMAATVTVAVPGTDTGPRASRTQCSASSPNTAPSLSAHPMGGETQKREPSAGTPMAATATVALPPSLVLTPTGRWPTRLPEETVQTAMALPIPVAGSATVAVAVFGVSPNTLPTTNQPSFGDSIHGPVGEPPTGATGTVALPSRASIVIVTYNGLLYTKMCLTSLLNDWHPNDELILVDNASTDGTVDFLRQFASQNGGADLPVGPDAQQRVPTNFIRVIFNEKNRGFAAANNQGLCTATGDVLILLNNDTLPAPGWRDGLVRWLGDADTGMVGPVTNRTCNEAQIDIPYHTYGELIDFARDYTQQHPAEGSDIGMLAMFCVALRRDVLHRVGPLDEQFALGMFEDDDYARRVREAGCRIVCAEDVFVHHFGQGSFGELGGNGEFHRILEANRLRFEKKWNTRWEPHRHRVSPEYRQLREDIRATVGSHLAPGATVIVASKGDPELLRLEGHRAWHFPQSGNGEYASSYPAGSSEAISHLEELRDKGADYLLIPKPAFWWLEPCLSGCYPHPQQLGCVHSPE